tara:strand:- start:1902 stop:2213 length:312 start_codon:yes stop_codon:yes gene_type:complete
MSWKDILKELSPRERMDADEFAPEEMQSDRDGKRRTENKGSLTVIRHWLEELDSDKPIEEQRFLSIRDSLQTLLRGFESAPRLRGKSREQVIENLTEFLEMVE